LKGCRAIEKALVLAYGELESCKTKAFVADERLRDKSFYVYVRRMTRTNIFQDIFYGGDSSSDTGIESLWP
jgi:hypothetical protein